MYPTRSLTEALVQGRIDQLRNEARQFSRVRKLRAAPRATGRRGGSAAR